MTEQRKLIKRERYRTKLSTTPPILLRKGDWLDVMDSDGVWNVAQVLSVPSSDEVEITYDGWPDVYNEVVCLTSNRVAPYNTFTWTVKCWVKYLNWPLWPSLITIRTPGTTEGITNLAAESRLFVDFLDDASFTKRNRCWQEKKHVRSFEVNYDKMRVGSTGESFERALEWVLLSTASTKFPKFSIGTLPKKYKTSPTKSVETVRRNMGDEQWFQSFIEKSGRHKLNHVYETRTDEDSNRSSNVSCSPRPNERYLDLSAVKKLPSLFNENRRSASIKIKRGSQGEVSNAHESTDSSSDGEVENEQDGSRPKKRKRLQTKRRSDGFIQSKKGGPQESRHFIGSNPIKPVAAEKIKTNSRKRTADALLDKYKEGRHQKVPYDSVTDCNKKSIKKHDTDANSYDHLKLDGSMKVESTSKSRTGTTKKRDSVQPQRQSKDVLENTRFQQLCRSSLSCSQGGSQRISAGVDPKNLQSHLESSPRSSKLQDLAQPKRNLQREGENRCGKIRELQQDRRKHWMQPFLSDDISSDGIISEDISDQATVSYSIEKNRSIQEVKSNDCVENYPLDGETKSICDDDCSQELRRRFCVMQADQGDADASEEVKCSTKTVISVPRTFHKVAPRAPLCCTNLLNRVTSPPGLRTLASDVRTGVPLAAPSTSVFSSSKGFSMRSWFDRKLVNEFMHGKK
ncbi:hypothetical protein PsorP6_005164 [Peronosclerospora sorghi]|uniref:Uncharacterized protein n=1 Tax=Peronosclerospora sorghi TaxID=230839 RepID=A0ACC0W3W7_9STRA|nr:hypothetical protein PsorP6_005164 [Peronosclerospora sorghi]